MNRILGSLAIAAWSAVAVGCGGTSHLPVPELAKVTGEVQISGKPAAGAVVVFHPKGDSRSQGGFGVVNDAGVFEATWRGERPGLQPGEYTVTVSRLALPDGSPLPPGRDAADLQAVETVPPEFNRPELSQQMLTVSNSGGELRIMIP